MKTFTVYSIAKTNTGSGHWKITFEFSTTENFSDRKEESFTTTDSQEIDKWGDDGAENLVSRHICYNMDEKADVKFNF